MTDLVDQLEPGLPFPIFRVSSQVERYLLYDINVITWLRKRHNILGVLIGTLPQTPQQNVFLGLPLELMPEEARLLVEKGLAYPVSDLERHKDGMLRLTIEQRQSFQQGLAREGRAAAQVAEQKKIDETVKAMRKLRIKSTPVRDETPDLESRNAEFPVEDEESNSLFDSVTSKAKPEQSSNLHANIWAITPTTSTPPFPNPLRDSNVSLPSVKVSSYALFKHLHSKGYFMSPGLRFGCQFTVYPGDPLRYHSHFLAVGVGWDEEFSLLDLVGGGRLGTGVKKGFLIGSPEAAIKGKSSEEAKVRTFCIEWGGM